MSTRGMARKSLEKRLGVLRPASGWKCPDKGWLRAIRDALGMTSSQMARRMGVSQPRIVALEKAEAKGSIKLDSLARAAEALDCTLVYAVVPNHELEAMVHERARHRARKILKGVAHSMHLENQGVHDREESVEQMASRLLRGNVRRLWDET